MKVHAVTIKPETPFGTSLKGDTIFGHFCWQAARDPGLLNGGLDSWMDCYQERPFAVFSTAWPVIANQEGGRIYCFPKPCLPVIADQGVSKRKRVEGRKEDKKKKWLLVGEGELAGGLADCKAVDDREILELHTAGLGPEKKKTLLFLPDKLKKVVFSECQAHNSINRLTMTTGKGFDPFSGENRYYLPGLELVIFAALDEDALDGDRFLTGLERIGQFGFGRDASSGLGRFSVAGIREISWPGGTDGQSVVTIGPCVPEKGKYEKQYFIPFTRFGRHGDSLALSGNPFKNPVVMADEGAVFVPAEGKEWEQPYLGCGVSGLSKVEKRTVCQGYSLYLPLARRSHE